MAAKDYWVEISQQGMRLGAGFMVTSHHALTASHCLRGIESDSGRLELSFAGGEMIPGLVCERVPGADLALIHILGLRESPLILPSADRACGGDVWFAPYRPSTSDPYLSGDVLSGPMSYQLEGGKEIEALQLGCSEHLGDYAGYSGGPVERNAASGEPALLGVLLEQYPDRGVPGRASDVLFAATITEAVRRFECLGADRLLKALPAEHEKLQECSAPVKPDHRDTAAMPLHMPRGLPDPDPGPGESLESRIAEANSIMTALREWTSSGLLSPLDGSTLALRAAKRVVDYWADGE